MSIVAARVDIARFGFEAFRASPRQADLLIISGRISIKMAPVVRRIYDQMLEPQVGHRDGRVLARRWACSTTTRSCPADKFMPVDIHVPGCPPRPEALMHGVLQAAEVDPGQPRPGLARPATAATGPRRCSATRAAPPRTCSAPEDTPVPDATGLELLAGELRDPRATAVVLDTVFFRRQRARSSSTPARVRDRARAPATPRAFSFLSSVHGVDYYPEEPRLGVIYELIDMEKVDRVASSAASTPSCPEMPSVVDTPPGRRPPGARGLRHVRRGLHRAPGPPPHPHARGLRGPPAAPRLPDRRRAGDLHLQRGPGPRLARVRSS